MADSELLDTLKALIVGKRGRARADRLVVVGADREAKTITVKPQKNVATYLDLVAALGPLRIEAFAGNELVGAWGELPPPRKFKKRVDTAPPAPRRGAASTPPETLLVPKKRRTDFAIVKDLTSHIANLISAAYNKSAERDAQRDATAFQALVDIAQHYADRSGNAEQRADAAAKSARLRDRAINERDSIILKLNAKIAEVAAAGGEDAKSKAFMELLKVASGGKPSMNGTTNGATAPAKGEA